MATSFSNEELEIDSENVKYTADEITSDYNYDETYCTRENGKLKVKPKTIKYTFKTQRKVPKLGVLFIGWGGNNGTTVTGGVIANRENITWETKNGTRRPDYVGSLTQSSTVKMGVCGEKEVYVPFNSLLPMVHPNDLVIGGWDINSMNLGDAMRRARVYDITFQDKVYPFMKDLVPMPSIYYPDFIAGNQADRADNVIPGDDKKVHLETIRNDIRHFKETTGVDKIIVFWTANTERFTELIDGVNDTTANLLGAIDRSESEIAPSTIFGVAAVLEGCSFINASPQNTLVPGLVELAVSKNVFVGGSDLKTGQTKIKSVLTDYLVSSGIKPTSICSYNHLGNNDGKNLSAPQQFRSKEISKSTVIDDMVNSNRILYKEGEKPDHIVVIKYVPFVGDSKRAIDEYTSEIFMGGINTISMHNTCEDSLLAGPIIIDLILVTELMERISIEYPGSHGFERMHSVLSVLSYLTKAPEVPRGTPVINALFKQRECIVNILRACLGLKPDNHMLLEYKLQHPVEK